MMKGFIKGFRFALQGIRWAWKGRNFRIQVACGLLVLVLSYALDITRSEWLVILVFTGLVPALELMNSAIEETINLLSPGFHPAAGKIKDLAAGSVLFLSIFALVTGVVIFLPYLIAIFYR